MISRAEEQATAERRKAFTDACKPIIHEAEVRCCAWLERVSVADLHQTQTHQLDHDFVLNVAKKVTDARKQVLEGVGKGMTKVMKNHA